MSQYILAIDQSTQATKALLFDVSGNLFCRADKNHEQMISEAGFVSHNAEEIYENVIQTVKDVVTKAGISTADVIGVGISNQRETALIWNRTTQKPVDYAVVWQCSRGKQICDTISKAGYEQVVLQKTGLRLSPYFSAAKIWWLTKHNEEAKELSEKKELCAGTIDSYLIHRLTGGQIFATDYSNASRTQLFNIDTLDWDEQLCEWFEIDSQMLPKVLDSNGEFGYTDFEGFFEVPVPIRGVMGDSHGALFGQGCMLTGMGKATYGTGSSIMVNVGKKRVDSTRGLVSSLAFGMSGEVSYVLEGNVNYTGAVITWLKENLKLIQDPKETEELAKQANANDTTYLIPAFTGLGAPHWKSEAKAMLIGMTRTTGKNEIVKAGVESISYQITDVLEAMQEDLSMQLMELRVDGGPTKNKYLMQFQSDILNLPILVSEVEELSGMGVAYAAGIALEFYPKEIHSKNRYCSYQVRMENKIRKKKRDGWKNAIQMIS